MKNTHLDTSCLELCHILLPIYSRLSLSQPHLSRITAYLKVKIWFLFKHENLTIGNKILWKSGETAPKEQFLLFSSIFSKFLYLKESNYIFISSPEQRSRRAIVIPPASALASASTQMLKFSLKFLRPHYFLILRPICFIFGIMIHIGPKFCAVHPHHPRSYQGQGHRLRI